MMLMVEERDWSGSTNPIQANGWTHYFMWPSMVKVKEFFHGGDDAGDPDYANDSGQSVCIGSIQYQIVCSYDCPGNVIKRNFWYPEKIIKQWNLHERGRSGYKLRSLGITRLGNQFFANVWFANGSDQVDHGIYRLWEDGGVLDYEPVTFDVFGNNIAQKNGLLYTASENDDYLHVLDINGNIKNTYTLPYEGDGHWRGCVWIGDTFLSSNQDTEKIFVFDKNMNVINTISMSQYKHDPGNVIPYGLWAYPFFMK